MLSAELLNNGYPIMKLVSRRFISCPLKDSALATSNTTLHNSHETENVTKAVVHKPSDRACTEFRDDHYPTIGDILQIPLISTHVQTNKELL